SPRLPRRCARTTWRLSRVLRVLLGTETGSYLHVVFDAPARRLTSRSSRHNERAVDWKTARESLSRDCDARDPWRSFVCCRCDDRGEIDGVGFRERPFTS